MDYLDLLTQEGSILFTLHLAVCCYCQPGFVCYTDSCFFHDNRTSELFLFTSSLVLSLPPMLIGIYVWVNVFRFYREVQKRDDERDGATFLVQSSEFLHAIITTEYNHGLIDLDDE